MGTLNPRPRGSRTLATNAKGDRNDREQIRRLLNARTVPPASDSVIATTVAQCIALDNTQIGEDLRYITANTWTFTTDESGLDGPSLVNVDGDERAFAPVEAGRYIFGWRFFGRWNNIDTPPTVVECHIFRENGVFDLLRTEVVAPGDGWAISSSQSGFDMDWATRPVYLAANETVWPRIRYFGTAPIVSDGLGFVMEVTRLA